MAKDTQLVAYNPLSEREGLEVPNFSVTDARTHAQTIVILL